MGHKAACNDRGLISWWKRMQYMVKKDADGDFCLLLSNAKENTGVLTFQEWRVKNETEKLWAQNTVVM